MNNNWVVKMYLWTYFFLGSNHSKQSRDVSSSSSESSIRPSRKVFRECTKMASHHRSRERDQLSRDLQVPEPYRPPLKSAKSCKFTSQVIVSSNKSCPPSLHKIIYCCLKIGCLPLLLNEMKDVWKITNPLRQTLVFLIT